MVHREDSYGAETLTLPEGTPEGQYLVTIELLPYEKAQSTNTDKTALKSDEKNKEKSQELESNSECDRASSDDKEERSESKDKREPDKESKAEDALLRDDKEEPTSSGPLSSSLPSSLVPLAESKVPVLPESSFSCNYSSSSSSRSRDSARERFGIVQGEGSVWVEWLVNTSRGGSVSVGAMTAAAAGDPDARYVRLCLCVHDCALLADLVSSLFLLLSYLFVTFSSLSLFHILISHILSFLSLTFLSFLLLSFSACMPTLTSGAAFCPVKRPAALTSSTASP